MFRHLPTKLLSKGINQSCNQSWATAKCHTVWSYPKTTWLKSKISLPHSHVYASITIISNIDLKLHICWGLVKRNVLKLSQGFPWLLMRPNNNGWQLFRSQFQTEESTKFTDETRVQILLSILTATVCFVKRIDCVLLGSINSPPDSFLIYKVWG